MLRVSDGIPKLLWFGVEGDYSIMVMELLGSNLDELREEVRGKVSLQTALLIVDQMVIIY
jgi:hypothetical protein